MFAALLLAGAASAQQSYRVWIDPEFESPVTVSGIVERALDVARRSDAAAAPPVIHAVYGCRGRDLPALDSRIPAQQEDWLWVVVMTGSFVFPHHGTFRNTEGYVLFHPVSGVSFGGGVFAVDPERLL